MLTQERLKHLLDYDPETGVFTRRVRTSNRIMVGQIAGTVHSKGYLCIDIDGRKYFAHRLAWLYVHGRWPKQQIDHINGNRSDNRLCNLREASHAENQHNRRRKNKNNTSGVPGVFWNTNRRKWEARICVDGKMIRLECYGQQFIALFLRRVHELAGKRQGR